MNTLILLNFSTNAVHFVRVSEELTEMLVNKYENDVESWADELFAEDIGVDMANCQWMLVGDKPDIYEHWQNCGKWLETKIYSV